MYLIFYLSSLPSPIEQIIPSKLLPYFKFDYFIYHVLEYSFLNLLLYRALIHTKNSQTSSILFAILYAITDEIHQYYVPGRNSNVFDLAYDSFGAIITQSIVNIYNWIKTPDKT